MLGSFTFILHTHLPYVLHHGKWPHGSDWLSEAAAECYIPILEILNSLDSRGISPRISMDFSPINLEQLADPGFVTVFTEYCDEKILAAEKDYDYFATNKEEHLQPLAEFWREFYASTKTLFLGKYHGDLVGGFKSLSDRGILDAMTCGATHGYFPLLLTDNNIRAQLRLAVATHQKHFGKTPRGIWIPECGYRPPYAWKPPVGPEYLRNEEVERRGVEELLAEVGLEYFVVDGALTKGGLSTGSYQFFEELHKLYEEYGDDFRVHDILEEDPNRSLSEMYFVNSGAKSFKGKMPTIFSRDAMTSALVWSADMGYPGHPPYLDFHKKHHNSGLRYWSVTGPRIDLAAKTIYDRDAIEKELEKDASHFVEIVRQTLAWHSKTNESTGIVASPFDTELFGHWWFEGPKFLEKVLEKLSQSEQVMLTDCAEAVDVDRDKREVIALPEGSWGEGGQHFVWLNKEVAWTWERIYPLEERFNATLRKCDEAGEIGDTHDEGTLLTILRQAARELLLMEASDWQFVISTRGAIDYSTKRFNEHCDRLEKMLDMIDFYLKGEGLTEEDAELLQEAIILDRPFEEIDLRWWMDPQL
jgi:1,4-alpha-glucan branching enzyme